MGFGRTITLCGLLLGLAVADRTEAAPSTATSNHGYLMEVAKMNQPLTKFLYTDPEPLAEEIATKLRHLEYVNPTSKWYEQELWNNPSKEDLKQVSSGQLVRTYFLLNALSNPEFRKKMGQEIELDTQDRSGEHGGIFRLNPDGSVKVEMLKNTFSCGQQEFTIGSIGCNPDDNYSPSSVEYKLDILLPFHFHAQEVDHSKSAALSGGDFFWGPGAVFTPVGKGKFNVDIALFYLKDEKNMKVDLDLGVYRY